MGGRDQKRSVYQERKYLITFLFQPNMASKIIGNPTPYQQIEGRNLDFFHQG
jgi:hypothetical protein